MTTDLRAALAAADPVTRPEYDAAALTARAHALLAEVATFAPEQPATPDHLDIRPVTTAQRRPGNTRRTRLILAAGVAAAAVAGVVTVVVSATGPRVDRQAAALLDAAADAIVTADPPTRPGQYWQTTSHGFGQSIQPAGNSTATSLVAQTSTLYTPVDGAGPRYAVSGPATVQRQLSAPPPDALTLSQIYPTGVATRPAAAPPGSWQEPTPAFLGGLPRDPDALLDRLRRDTAGAGKSADGEVFVTVDDVLGSPLVPADLRQALYRALALVPGVVVTAGDVSLGGRTGVAFAYDEAADGSRRELVVDPDTGERIGERDVSVSAHDDVPAGTVVGEQAVTRTLVDAVPAAVVVAATGGNCTVSADTTVTCPG